MKFLKIIAVSAIFPLLVLSQSNDELISFIEQFTDSITTTGKQPGVIVSITKGDEIIYEKAKGYADIKTNAPMDTKMRFRIGSLTKTFTATVLLQLVDEGLLKLDDNIDKYFPHIPNAKKITVRMLGDMSSGLYNYSEAQEFDDAMRSNPKKKWKPEELVNMSIKYGTYFEPGEGWHYSNTNTILLGMLIEKLTDRPLESEIKTRIIDKLGLAETEFPADSSISGNHPHGYNEDEGKFEEPLDDVTEKYDPSWGWAAGAMISSLHDIKIYLKAFVSGLMLKKETHEARMKWALDQPGIKYGFGLFKVGDDFIGHNGSYPGFHNISVHSPQTNTTIIVFYNSQTNRNPDDFLKALLPYLK